MTAKSTAARKTIWTRNALTLWLQRNRPELALYERHGARGFYRRDAGPAASLASAKTWAEIAARLGAK